jgi:hypothetical protein
VTAAEIASARTFVTSAAGSVSVIPDAVADRRLRGCGRKEVSMAAVSASDDANRAAEHAAEAERLLRGKWISAHVKAQAHATLAVYYSAKR